MTTIEDNYVNGSKIHYFANDTEICHPAIVCGGYTSDTEAISTNLIQLDGAIIGTVVLPIIRTDIAFDEEMPYGNNTAHSTCARYGPL